MQVDASRECCVKAKGLMEPAEWRFFKRNKSGTADIYSSLLFKTAMLFYMTEIFYYIKNPHGYIKHAVDSVAILNLPKTERGYL